MIKALEIAVVLTAVDRMSQVFNSVINASSAKLKGLQEQFNKNFDTGKLLFGAGTAIALSLSPAVSAFAELEGSSLRLQSVMIRDGGAISENFAKVNALAIQIGNRLPGTTADFQNMFAAMLRSGITEKSVLEGVGEATAYLAVAMKMGYEEAGIFAAKLKVATGVADNEMLGFLDTIHRLYLTGAKSDEMTYAFARSAGALKLMNLQGLEASKSVAVLYGMLLRTGQSGETIGTGTTRVFNAMFDVSKMNTFNKATAALGVQLQFIDQKTGQFLGVENMVAQFEKLKKFNPQQRAIAVDALLGTGADANFMNIWIDQGIDGFNKLSREAFGKGTLSKAVESQLVSLKNVWEATTGTFTNTLASFGAAIAPELKKVLDLFTRIAIVIQHFAEEHPKLFKFVGIMVAMVSVIMMVVGVVLILKAVFIAFNMVLMANPIIFIIAAIVALAVLIYVYWEDIVGFFKWVWEKIKVYFAEAWKYIQYLPIFAIPMLIIKYWDRIADFFSNLWARIKQVFLIHVMFILRLPLIFFNAGVNIVKMLWNGIKSMASKPIEAIKEITKKMRDYLPFSPAKEGAFRDLHKVQIVQTIANAMKPTPLIRAMAAVTSQAAAYSPGGGGSFGGTNISGGGITISYAPVISINGSISDGAKEGFAAELRRHKDDIMRVIDEALQRRERLKF